LQKGMKAVIFEIEIGD